MSFKSGQSGFYTVTFHAVQIINGDLEAKLCRFLLRFLYRYDLTNRYAVYKRLVENPMVRPHTSTNRKTLKYRVVIKNIFSFQK